MNFLSSLLGLQDDGQTPWAKEQMARMLAGGMSPMPPAGNAAYGPAYAAGPTPPRAAGVAPGMPQSQGQAPGMGPQKRPPAAVMNGPEPVTAAPSMGTYLAGAMRGASQANNPLGGILGAIGGALDAGEGVNQQNQTFRLLVSKGIPEADAALAVKNPQFMQTLLSQAMKANAPMSETDRLDLEYKRAQIDKLRAPDDDIREVGGRLVRVGPNGVKELYSAPDAAKPTDDIAEYNYAKRQGFTGTFQDYMLAMKKAGATAITLDQRGDNAFTKKAAEMEAGRYEDLVKGAKTARENMANLDALEEALNAYQEGSFFGSGSFGPAETSARAAGLALGIGNADTVGAAQLADAIRNKLTLSARSTADGAGMPGALSDADREFLKATTAGLDKTPAGNKRIIDVSRALEKRRLEVANMAAKYVEANGRLDTRFDQEVEAWAKANPLFPQAGGERGDVSAPVKVNTIEDALKLPKGTRFVTPDGREKVR